MNLPGDIKEMLRDFRGAQEMSTPHGDAMALEIAADLATRLEFMNSRSEAKRVMRIGGGEIEITPNGTNEVTQVKVNDGVYYHSVIVGLKSEEILALGMLLLERYNEIGINRINTAKETSDNG